MLDGAASAAPRRGPEGRGPRCALLPVRFAMTIYTFLILTGVLIFNSALFVFLYGFIRRHARREDALRA